MFVPPDKQKTEKPLNKTICVRVIHNKWVFSKGNKSWMNQMFPVMVCLLVKFTGLAGLHFDLAALQVDTWYKAGIAEGISVSVNQRG